MLAVPKAVGKILSLESPPRHLPQTREGVLCRAGVPFLIENVRPIRAASMSIDPGSINIAAADMLSAFQRRVASIPYERKGILYSEMFFLYLCAQAAKPNRVVESGRARGQSTLLLSTIFSDLPIVSIESDPHSPDVPVAQERLRGRSNVSLRSGDMTRILPAEVRQGNAVLIDGPKGFRGLRLALRHSGTGV